MSITPDKRDELRESLRLAVIDALDDWVLEHLSDAEEAKAIIIAVHKVLGATDADLPHIFPAIDAQFDRLLDRFGVLVVPETREQAMKELGL